jgi:non-ribosomal peptide synthetase component F
LQGVFLRRFDLRRFDLMSGNDFDTVPQCFQIPATETPGFFAVRSDAERLTYAGLDARTDALRDRLNAAGVEKGALAGILLDRSLSAITSFLAVLKAGGALVPLDPSGPPQGILDIIQRHKLTCVISNAATLRRFPQLAAAVPVIDVDAAPVAGAAGRRGEAVKVAGSDPACVMFTSGASGEPKGVVIPHRVIVGLVKNPGYMRVLPDQTFVQASPLAFDASVFEIWGALLNGAELVILPAGLRSPETIAAAVAEQGVTTLFLARAIMPRLPAAFSTLCSISAPARRASFSIWSRAATSCRRPGPETEASFAPWETASRSVFWTALI